MPSYRLAPVQIESDWDAYHRIREHVLFEARGRFGAYDRNHPDERIPGNHPLLLFLDRRPVGVIRVDVCPPVAYFRRVAIVTELQRLGHGTAMLNLAERFALDRGCSTICSNVDPGAVSFYSRLGFSVDPDRKTSPSIAMTKALPH